MKLTLFSTFINMNTSRVKLRLRKCKLTLERILAKDYSLVAYYVRLIIICSKKV